MADDVPPVPVATGTPGAPTAARRRGRDRRGRGMRGPAVLPRVPGVPETRTRRERFDDLVLGVAHALEERWSDRLGLVEYAVEDAPQVPDDWGTATVPLTALVPGSGGAATRIVVFRRPLEHRATGLSDLEALVHTVVVEQVADLLGLPPEEVDPSYDPGDDLD